MLLAFRVEVGVSFGVPKGCLKDLGILVSVLLAPSAWNPFNMHDVFKPSRPDSGRHSSDPIL